MMKRLFIFIGIFFLTINVFGQINISFPTTRAVFQRDKNNSADIYVSGIFSAKQVDRVEARLSPFVTGQGTDTGWQIIQSSPQGGVFLGKIKGIGGWYRLDVRTVSGSNIIETSGVDRVGVGEVFIIAGQSNAQGHYKNQGEKGSSDDRVSCVNYFNGDSLATTSPLAFNPTPLTNLTFSHVDQNVNLGPMGYGVWCWGMLGDMLTSRLNVPVLFLNTALQGTSVSNWSQSAQGLSTVINGRTFSGFPYLSLKNAINFYSSLLGVRAVLWHQGETDNVPLQTPTSVYASYLQNVIDISRRDANRNISWVIARASLNNYVVTSPSVIAGQNQVLATPNNNVFDGPPTDVIQVPRPDGVHFQSLSGLTSLASAWNAYLNVSFFQNSSPVSALTPVPTQFVCSGTNMTLSVPNTYTTYNWTNGNNSNSITVNSTDNTVYSVLLRDNANNYFYSIPIRPSLLSPSIPNIVAKSSTQFCADKAVDLSTTSSNLQSLVWNTGETSSSITVRATGSYYLQTTNNLGCTSQSNSISTNVIPLPATPSISINNSPANSCEGSLIVLLATNVSSPTLKLQWNLNATPVDSTSSLIPITKIGTYSYTLRTKDSFGCYSSYSTPANVSIRANPPTPTVTVNGSLSSCYGNTVTLSSPASAYKTFWTTGDTTKSISFSTIGDYFVSMRITDDIGCMSPISNGVKFSIHPLPDKPTISVNGSLNICEGTGVTTLTASSTLKSFWNTATNDSTRSVSFSKSGDYNVAVRVRDNFNCYSPYSNSVKVSIRPIPAIPSITQIGNYTLQANSLEDISNDTFEWKKDNLILANKTNQLLKTSLQGYYGVIDLRTYSVDNGIKLTCRSGISNTFGYVPSPNIGGMNVYPNPNTSGIFSVETKEDLTNAIISLYTMNGQWLTSFPYATLTERKVLNFSDLVNGEYILKIQSDSFNSAKKIIIQK